MPQFNRATMSMKTLGTLILESDIEAKSIDKKLNSAVKQLNSGKLTEENVKLFCNYVRRLMQLLEAIKIYVEREQFIDEKVLLEWENHIKRNNTTQLELGSEQIFDSVHKILFRVSPRLRKQARNEVTLMRGKNPAHSSFSTILFNDRLFYAKIEEESEFVRSNIERIHMLRYEAQSALLKLSSQPNRQNLESFRASMMRLLRHISENLFMLFNIEEDSEAIESHLIREIDAYIAICKIKSLDNLKKQLEDLKSEVSSYFQKGLMESKQMLKATAEFIQQSAREVEELKSEVVVEELLDTNSSLFAQAYKLLTKDIPLPLRETKRFMRSSLGYKLAGVSYPLINHVIIARKGSYVSAVLYGQYFVRANAGLIGYVVSDHSGNITASIGFKMFNQLFLAFQSDARRHGKALWVAVGEMDASESGSDEARLINIGFKRYGGVPLDFDYYPPPISPIMYVFYKLPFTKPKKLVLFVMSPRGKINGLPSKDLIGLLEVLYEDVYGIRTNHKFFRMTLASIGNREFIGPKKI